MKKTVRGRTGAGSCGDFELVRANTGGKQHNQSYTGEGNDRRPERQTD